MSDANIESISALTPLQEGILFHALDASIPGVYFDQFVCTIEGNPDIAALREAWQNVIARHSVLRTFFTWEKRDKPLQIVRRHVEVPWLHEDWTDRQTDQQSVKAFLEADRARGFHLSKAPLMRVALLTISSAKVQMIWSFHHLILDGWSVRLLLMELQTLYADAMHGVHRQLPRPAPFVRFVEWHQQQSPTKDTTYWSDYLQGFTRPTCPDIYDESTVKNRAENDVFGQVVEKRIEPALYDNLKRLAQRQRVTPNTVFVAAWAVLLSRYCDANDVVFGTTVAGRPMDLAGVEQIAGLFINTIPVRTRFTDSTRVAELLKQVQVDQTQQREFHHSSLAQVQRSSELAPGTPLFETILVYENFPAFKSDENSEDTHTLKFSNPAYHEYSNFPLALLVVPDDALSLIAVHNTQRFSSQTISTLLGHLTQLLTEFAEQPDAPVNTLSIFGTAERNLYTSAIAHTANDWPKPMTVVDLFEQQVAQHPEATAITAADQCLSYSQLDTQANKLAQQILSQSPMCGAALIYCERDSHALIAMFGALKAGLPYVVFDIKDPVARVDQIIDDICEAGGDDVQNLTPLIITQPHICAQLPDTVPLLKIGENNSAYPDHNPGIRLSMSQMAYIIYTSGSTGVPKGVMMSHASLSNSTRARFEYYKEPVKNFALLSSLSTDSSIAGVFWTLCSGGNLLIPDSRAELDIATLARTFHQHRITHTLCVPSLYTLILEHSDTSMLESLKTVVVAGEACGSSLVRQHFATLSMTRLYNEYGPSEACVWATVEQLFEADADHAITIGRPIANTSVYVLDQHDHPVPTGVSGELCIGGANIALGYLGREQDTQRAFIANPFDTRRHPVLYKTGDRVRLLANHKIQFLGRIDHQVKVRGYRVEPGEIESTLMTHPQVSSAVVLIDDTANLDKELGQLLAHTDSAIAEQLLTEIEQLSEREAILQQNDLS